MKAIKIEPGKAPVVIDVYNDQYVLQDILGGTMKCIRLPLDYVAILLDENGKAKQLEPNIIYKGEQLYGTMLIVGFKNYNFCTLTPQQIQKYSALFASGECG